MLYFLETLLLEYLVLFKVDPEALIPSVADARQIRLQMINVVKSILVEHIKVVYEEYDLHEKPWTHDKMKEMEERSQIVILRICYNCIIGAFLGYYY